MTSKRINNYPVFLYILLLAMPIQVEKLFIIINFNWKNIDLFIDKPLLWKVLENLSLFDTIFPFVFILLLYGIFYKKNSLPNVKNVLISISPFVAAHLLIPLFYYQSDDFYYSLSYIYGVAILLLFYHLSETLLNLDKTFVVFFFPLFLLLPIICYFLYGFDLIIWNDNFYTGFSSILANRLELLSRGPAWLASYMMFILYIFILWSLGSKISVRYVYLAFSFIFIIALMTKSRDLSLILCTIAFYIYKRCSNSYGRVWLISFSAFLLTSFAMVSLFINVFPLSEKYPYINLEVGQYKIIQQAHIDYIIDNNILYGNGYSAAKYAEKDYRNDQQTDVMLNSYGVSVEVKSSWINGSRGPHNSYLRLLEGGGVVLIFCFVFIFVYPIRNKLYLYRRFFFPVCMFAISGLYSEVINYRWFWALAGIYMYLVLREDRCGKQIVS